MDYFPSNIGNGKSSQLTKSIIFQRARLAPTNQMKSGGFKHHNDGGNDGELVDEA